MTAHGRHETIETAGLADDCPRCAEIASDPIFALDSGNLLALLRRTREWIIDLQFPRSETEKDAMRVVEEHLVRQRHIDRVTNAADVR